LALLSWPSGDITSVSPIFSVERFIEIIPVFDKEMTLASTVPFDASLIL